MSLPPEDPAPAETPEALDVYWRPGCGFCSRLFRRLGRAGVVVRRHNIWEDPDARQFVRDHNRGDETVPTVDLAGEVRTNPSPDDLIEAIRGRYPHLVAETDGHRWPARRSHKT